MLKAGELVGVAVGGLEEALFDWDYNTLWGDRNGFAKLALITGIDRPNTHSVIGFTFTSFRSLLRISDRPSTRSPLEVI